MMTAPAGWVSPVKNYPQSDSQQKQEEEEDTPKAKDTYGRKISVRCDFKSLSTDPRSRHHHLCTTHIDSFDPTRTFHHFLYTEKNKKTTREEDLEYLKSRGDDFTHGFVVGELIRVNFRSDEGYKEPPYKGGHVNVLGICELPKSEEEKWLNVPNVKRAVIHLFDNLRIYRNPQTDKIERIYCGISVTRSNPNPYIAAIGLCRPLEELPTISTITPVITNFEVIDLGNDVQWRILPLDMYQKDVAYIKSTGYKVRTLSQSLMGLVESGTRSTKSGAKNVYKLLSSRKERKNSPTNSGEKET